NHTITASFFPAEPSGTQTLAYRQSSAGVTPNGAASPGNGFCAQSAPYSAAGRTPVHAFTGAGARHRKSPTGAAANGIPLNPTTPSRATPFSRPVSIFTSSEAAKAVETTMPAVNQNIIHLRVIVFLSRHYLEVRMQGGGGIRAYPQIEVFRLFDPAPACRAPVTQFALAQGDVNRLLLSRLEPHFFESLQLAHRPRRAARHLVDVHLHHFRPRAPARVLHVGRHLYRAAQFHGARLQPQVGDAPLRVTQTVAERIQRRPGLVP